MYKLKIFSIFLTLGILTLGSGCSSISGKSVETTVNPEFDVTNYHRVYVVYVDDNYFLMPAVEAVFEDNGFENLNNRKYLKEHDLNVIVTTDTGFCLPPTPTSGRQGPLFVQPKMATVEIQDAMTKKQLLLCTYRRGFFGTSSYNVCRDMLVAELTSVLTELKTKNKPAPDDKAK